MLRSSSCDYCDAYILVSGTITINGARNDDVTRLDKRNKEAIFKNCTPFTDCISDINNTQKGNAKYIDAVIPMYNLIKYDNNYLKASRNLWQYYTDDPNDNIT